MTEVVAGNFDVEVMEFAEIELEKIPITAKPHNKRVVKLPPNEEATIFMAERARVYYYDL